jgi:hypothetical protein
MKLSLPFGEIYLHEVMNAGALLGSLPENIDGVWQATSDKSGYRQRCIDRRSGDILDEDSRLGPLPDGWHHNS